LVIHLLIIIIIIIIIITKKVEKGKLFIIKYFCWCSSGWGAVKAPHIYSKTKYIFFFFLLFFLFICLFLQEPLLLPISARPLASSPSQGLSYRVKGTSIFIFYFYFNLKKKQKQKQKQNVGLSSKLAPRSLTIPLPAGKRWLEPCFEVIYILIINQLQKRQDFDQAT